MRSVSPCPLNHELSAYACGQADLVDSATIADHLKACATCRNSLRKLAQGLSTARSPARRRDSSKSSEAGRRVRLAGGGGANAGQTSIQGWDPLESTCRHASLSIL